MEVKKDIRAIFKCTGINPAEVLFENETDKIEMRIAHSDNKTYRCLWIKGHDYLFIFPDSGPLGYIQKLSKDRLEKLQYIRDCYFEWHKFMSDVEILNMRADFSTEISRYYDENFIELSKEKVLSDMHIEIIELEMEALKSKYYNKWLDLLSKEGFAQKPLSISKAEDIAARVYRGDEDYLIEAKKLIESKNIHLTKINRYWNTDGEMKAFHAVAHTMSRRFLTETY